MVYATPGINGNSAEDFQAAGLALYESTHAVREALAQVRAECFNGRNYQTVSPTVMTDQGYLGYTAQDADMDRVKKALHALSEIERLASELHMKGDD